MAPHQTFTIEEPQNRLIDIPELEKISDQRPESSQNVKSSVGPA